MREMIAAGVKVQCVVTSPPYWGLRDYGVPGQIGLERTPIRYLTRMRGVLRLVRELLADDGVLWLNMGDSYATDGKSGGKTGGKHAYLPKSTRQRAGRQKRRSGLKQKDMVGMPWMLALLLRADGWYLRQEIIWNKPAPMPESVTDRCTKAHEHLFLLTKSPRYYYDADAIKEPVTGGAHSRGDGVNPKAVSGWDVGKGAHSTLKHANRGPKDTGRAEQGLRDSTKFGRGAGGRNKQNESFSAAVSGLVESRNKRTVWTIASEPYSEAHFATFPRKLVEPCILAGSRPGDVVFDPFMGSGTVAQVAEQLGRKWLGIDLNPEYLEFQRDRLRQQQLRFDVLPVCEPVQDTLVKKRIADIDPLCRDCKEAVSIATTAAIHNQEFICLRCFYAEE